RFVVCNCADLVARRISLSGRTGTLVFNLARFANVTIQKSENRLCPERLAQLQCVLAECFPTNHPVELMAIEPSGGVATSRIAISGLSEALSQCRPTVTLFVPPIN